MILKNMSILKFQNNILKNLDTVYKKQQLRPKCILEQLLYYFELSDYAIQYIDLSNISNEVLESVKKNQISFFDELTIDDDTGAEYSVYYAIVSIDEHLYCFKSNKDLEPFVEFKKFKKYQSILLKNNEIGFIPYTLFCLELYKKIPQSKITEITIFIKKIKELSKTNEYEWKKVCLFFCMEIIFFSFKLNEEELPQSEFFLIFKDDVLLKESGNIHIILEQIQEFVENPSAECRKKKMIKINETEDKNLKKIIKEESSTKTNFIVEVFNDFFEVLFSISRKIFNN